jgi:DNA invertase Pin-like site-specific DNA recombinase
MKDNTMTRIFSYLRVSTTEQTTANQSLAIEKAGYSVEPNRIITETISGSVQASKRPEFVKLLDKLEFGDTLILLKLDRLGRDNIDVQQTILMLDNMGVKVCCLDLPVKDLSTSEGKLMLQMFSAFAEFERNRLKERTVEGLARAKNEGKILGRPKAIKTTVKVQKLKTEGLTQSQTAKALDVSVMTVKRHWNK